MQWNGQVILLVHPLECDLTFISSQCVTWCWGARNGRSLLTSLTTLDRAEDGPGYSASTSTRDRTWTNISNYSVCVTWCLSARNGRSRMRLTTLDRAEDGPGTSASTSISDRTWPNIPNYSVCVTWCWGARNGRSLLTSLTTLLRAEDGLGTSASTSISDRTWLRHKSPLPYLSNKCREQYVLSTGVVRGKQSSRGSNHFK